ncbi:MAG TPA: endonuclease/exonuclease/phosphatase family protein [Planctomycetota bacterium]|nr:endonuclease/exonuclease/phosphatase family protein [Planctomycetota bacterium]
MLGIMLAQLSAWTWYGELASHWTLHGAVALLPAMVVFRRDTRWGRLFMALFVIALLPWIQASWSARAVVSGAPIAQATVAAANVQFFNPDRGPVQAAIATWDVDLLALEEVTTSDETALRPNPHWPFQVWSGHTDVTKVALLSRRRIVSHKIHDFDGYQVIEALVDLGESPLRVFVVHPAAPISPELSKRRDRQLVLLAQELTLERHPEPVLVLGDFNLTCGTSLWRSFIGYTHLRRAPGPSPATWPSVLGPFGITIDHLLARGAGIDGVTAFTIPGSDHRGVTATIAIGEP